MARGLFLTGGSGFVGSHVAQAFLDRGWRVRALVRRPGRLPPGAQSVRGDLLEPQTYAEHLRGCELIVHVAGLTRAASLAEFRRANALGSEVLARAVREACPDAFLLHVSSQAAAGPSPDGAPVTESTPPRPISWYGQSKLEGERAIEYYHRGPWCIVRPSVVFGPGDPGMLDAFAVVAKGFAPILGGGRQRLQLLAVDDLARILLALSGRLDLSGRRGFAAGDTVSIEQITREMASYRTPPPRIIRVPGWLIRLVGVVEAIREVLTGRTLPLSRDKVREIVQPAWVCDAEPFLVDLGITGLVPWQQGLRQTCRWYVKEQWLPPCFDAV